MFAAQTITPVQLTTPPKTILPCTTAADEASLHRIADKTLSSSTFTTRICSRSLGFFITCKMHYARLTIIAVLSLTLGTSALPLSAQEQPPLEALARRRVAYSVVDVDGGSSTSSQEPSTTTELQTVTETTSVSSPVTETVVSTADATTSAASVSTVDASSSAAETSSSSVLRPSETSTSISTVELPSSSTPTTTVVTTATEPAVQAAPATTTFSVSISTVNVQPTTVTSATATLTSISHSTTTVPDVTIFLPGPTMAIAPSNTSSCTSTSISESVQEIGHYPPSSYPAGPTAVPSVPASAWPTSTPAEGEGRWQGSTPSRNETLHYERGARLLRRKADLSPTATPSSERWPASAYPTAVLPRLRGSSDASYRTRRVPSAKAPVHKLSRPQPA